MDVQLAGTRTLVAQCLLLLCCCHVVWCDCWCSCSCLCCVCLRRSGKVTDEVYGQEVMFVANDWHAALLPLLLTARFRCVVVPALPGLCMPAAHAHNRRTACLTHALMLSVLKQPLVVCWLSLAAACELLTQRLLCGVCLCVVCVQAVWCVPQCALLPGDPQPGAPGQL